MKEIDINNDESLSILDCSEEVIQGHLKMTGQTREELEAQMEAYKSYDTTPLEGSNPDLKDYFTQNPGMQVIE